MTTWYNQTIGSHDDKREGSFSAFQYVEVWHDDDVTGFKFHNISMADVQGFKHGVYGITVDARHVWAAITAFSGAPELAIMKDGSERYVQQVWLNDAENTQELRMGGKYGAALARVKRTGYNQNPPRQRS